MSNPIRGEYELTFLDPPRKWRICLNEQAVIEAQLEVRRGQKVPFETWLSNVGKWTTEDWRLLMWAGCRRYDKQVTEEQLGEEIDAAGLLEFRALVVDWMSKLYPESSKKKLEDAVRQAAGGLKTHGTQESGSPSA